MQQLSGAFRSLPKPSRRIQGSVRVPADAACAQMPPPFSARSSARPAAALRDMSEHCVSVEAKSIRGLPGASTQSRRGADLGCAKKFTKCVKFELDLS